MELTTCLWFDGNAREAAEFYVSIFPESSLGNNWIAPTDTPGNLQGSEVVVDFVIFGRPFIALNGGMDKIVDILFMRPMEQTWALGVNISA